MYDLTALAGLGVLVLAGVAKAADVIRHHTPGPPFDDPVARERWRYARPVVDEDGQPVAESIGLATFERRIEPHLDPAYTRLYAAVSEAHGVDASTARALYHEYHFLDEVRDASAAELTDVHGIGEERAAAIAAAVDES